MNIQFCFLLLHFLRSFYINAEPLLKISQGILNGTIQISRYGRTYSAFLGIPYGQPPIKKLRFSNPVPAECWEGIRPADSFGNICPQNDNAKIIGNEDCLFLNVYTPFLEFNSSLTNNTLLPVMVWIHGGGFIAGSSNMYGAGYLLDKDIVLVTINYRLGIFGFLSTGNSAAPGNFGLKDQVLALKWVQENIRAFEGDPKRVTLFGESAGGASVSLHAISKANTGLFQQYIIQSGAVLCPWAYQKRINFIIYVREIAALVGCPFITSTSLVDCLRRRSVARLINTSSIFGTIARLAQLTWTPTDEPESEDAFLTDSPKNLINNNQMKDLPFMSGGVTDEGLLITGILYSNDLLYHFIKLNINTLIAYVSDYYLDSKNDIGFTFAVDRFYFNNSLIFARKKEFLDSLTRFFSDGFFHYPQVRMLEKATPKMKSSNYFYSFGYRGKLSLSSGIEINGNLGVAHGDEVLYLFPVTTDSFSTSNSNFTDIDKSISNLMVEMWTSFAINGKPTSSELIDPNLWIPFTTQNNIHLQIGNIRNNRDPTVTISNNFYKDRMDFWRNNAPI